MNIRRNIFFVLLIFSLITTLSAAARSYTLVIDAGHGGNDAGAVGASSKEKNLTLKYALAFGQMVERNCPEVKVIYTRKTDRFLELWQRAEIANKNKADLFISIHINALPKGQKARGFQTYTLGKGKKTGRAGFIENLEVAKRENSVIFLEKDYKQTYHGYDPNSPESDIMFEFIQDENMVNSINLAKLMQKHVCAATGRQDQGAHQDNLAVLRLTSMPGCLLELGFISTPDEEQFLNAARSTEKYARGMFNAFQAYRRLTDKSVPAPMMEKTKQETAQTDGHKDDSQATAKMKDDSAAAVKMKGDSAATAKAKTGTGKTEKTKTEKLKATTAEDDTITTAQADDRPIFKVQFLTSGTKLKSGAREFKGLTGVDSYKEGGLWKFTVGASADLSAIQQLRREVAKTFPQAFIVAFKNGKRTDAEKARQEYRKTKR